MFIPKYFFLSTWDIKQCMCTRADPGGGANLRFCQIFLKNSMKLRKLWAVGGCACVKLASVSVWVSVWVIWRITNRHTFRILPILNSAYFTAWYDELRIGILLKYADLRIGSILKVCRFLIRHTLPHGMTIWRRHSVKYAELRIGILLKVCRFLIRHTLPNADL